MTGQSSQIFVYTSVKQKVISGKKGGEREKRKKEKEKERNDKDKEEKERGRRGVCARARLSCFCCPATCCIGGTKFFYFWQLSGLYFERKMEVQKEESVGEGVSEKGISERGSRRGNGRT